MLNYKRDETIEKVLREGKYRANLYVCDLGGGYYNVMMYVFPGDKRDFMKISMDMTTKIEPIRKPKRIVFHVIDSTTNTRQIIYNRSA
jgi:hypothetical protein